MIVRSYCFPLTNMGVCFLCLSVAWSWFCSLQDDSELYHNLWSELCSDFLLLWPVAHELSPPLHELQEALLLSAVPHPTLAVSSQTCRHQDAVEMLRGASQPTGGPLRTASSAASVLSTLCRLPQHTPQLRLVFPSGMIFGYSQEVGRGPGPLACFPSSWFLMGAAWTSGCRRLGESPVPDILLSWWLFYHGRSQGFVFLSPTP